MVPTPAGRALADRATAFRLGRLAHLLEGWAEDEVHAHADGLRHFAEARVAADT